MKKNLVFLYLISVGVIFLCSCEEDFSPYGELKEKYILNCILSADTTSQVATVSQSYFVEGTDPYLNTIDPNIQGASIRISFEDSAKVFAQDSMERIDQSHYTTPAIFYYSDNFTPAPDTEYRIETLLPDGRRLRGKTRTPAQIAFNAEKSDSLIPMPGSDYIEVFWNSPGQDLYVSSVFTIVYFKDEPEGQVRHIKKVPVKYVKQGNSYIPHFPEPSYSTKIYAELDAFSRALEEISEGDPNKSDYTILAFILEIRIYDENLTSYFASQKEIGDSFTLKVDESDYTNIEGGFGIFGSYIKQKFAIRFDHDYIRSFRYTPGLTQ